MDRIKLIRKAHARVLQREREQERPMTRAEELEADMAELSSSILSHPSFRMYEGDVEELERYCA